MKCVKCNFEILENENFCGCCGLNLNQVQENNREIEKIGFAENCIIDCEGNKFKAIKLLREKFKIDNDTASKYINRAYDKFQKKKDPLENQKNDQIPLKKKINAKEIKRTIIVANDNSVELNTSIARGAVGAALLGPIGLLAAATGSGVAKNTTTFQVIYLNNYQKTVTVKNDSKEFKNYCKYLDK